MLEDQTASSVYIHSFVTFQNNQVNYISIVNHVNLGMIQKYYLSLDYLVLEKLLKFYHIIFLFVITLNLNLWISVWKLIALKKEVKKYWLKNPLIYEVIPIERFVDINNLLKIVQVGHKTMLEKN
jgi:hypothetical protein